MMNRRFMVIDDEKVKAYLAEKKLDAKCSLCGKGDFFIIGDISFHLQGTTQDTEIINRSMPLVAMSCYYCGNTYFIDATAQKLLKPLGQEDEEAERDGK